MPSFLETRVPTLHNWMETTTPGAVFHHTVNSVLSILCYVVGSFLITLLLRVFNEPEWLITVLHILEWFAIVVIFGFLTWEVIATCYRRSRLNGSVTLLAISF